MVFLLFYNVCHLKIKMPNYSFFGVRVAGWRQAFNCSFLQRELEVYVVVCLLHSSRLHLFSWDENENKMRKTSDAEKHSILYHRSLWQIWLNISVFLSENVFPGLFSQIDHYAQRDLKKGLQLFGTEGNVGLTNAWMIVQTDVRTENPMGLGWWVSFKVVEITLSVTLSPFEKSSKIVQILLHIQYQYHLASWMK